MLAENLGEARGTYFFFFSKSLSSNSDCSKIDLKVPYGNSFLCFGTITFNVFFPAFRYLA